MESNSLCDTHLQSSELTPLYMSFFVCVVDEGTSPKAVICVLIFKDSPNSLAMKHLLDVGSRFGGRQQTPAPLDLDHVACPIHPTTGWHLLLPASQNRPSMGLPYGWLAMSCTWRTDGFSAFLVIDHHGQLRRTLNVGDSTVPCRHVIDLQPGHPWQPASATALAY